MEQYQLLPEIESTLQDLSFDNIPQERLALLDSMASYVREKVHQQLPVSLNFICTHNSRRSILSQAWAQAIAYSKGLNITCYSGGTEATAFFPQAAITLEKSGFNVQKLSNEKNPVYAVKYAGNAHPLIAFSKTYDDGFNPTGSFAAVMTCSQADQGCPFIPGAEKRFPLNYEDPKAFDGTPQQEEKYLERSNQIATELLYVFSKV